MNEHIYLVQRKRHEHVGNLLPFRTRMPHCAKDLVLEHLRKEENSGKKQNELADVYKGNSKPTHT